MYAPYVSVCSYNGERGTMEQQDRGEKPEGCAPMHRQQPVLARSSRRVRACMVILVLGLWATEAVAAEPYDQPTERRAAEVLPPAMAVTPNHRVQDPVVADGYMDRFTVESSRGSQRAPTNSWRRPLQG